MRLRQIPWAIALVCVVLGFMLAMQFKVQKQVQLRDVTAFQRAQDLAAQLDKAEKELDAVMIELDDTRGKVQKLANDRVEFSDLAEQLALAQLHAGLVPVTGPGVVVTMIDSTRTVSPTENANSYIIHDEDVLKVINELAAAGAEAMSINEQRLVAGSEIRCTGPTITINGVRKAPPIVIKAVGPANELETAITIRDGIADLLNVWGISVTVRKEAALLVPAYKGSLKLQFAVPATQEVTRP